MIEDLKDLIKHLDPNAIYVKRCETEDGEIFWKSKVICGDKRIFQEMPLEKMGKDPFDKKIFTFDQLRFITPEKIKKSRIIETNSKEKLELLPFSQLWWDLGIIMYELSSGNHPF